MDTEKELSDGAYIVIMVGITSALLVLGLSLNNTIIIELGLCGALLAIPHTIITAVKAVMSIAREHKRRG